MIAARAVCPGCGREHAVNGDGVMRMHSPNGYRGGNYNPNVCIGVGQLPGTIICNECNRRGGEHYRWCSSYQGEDQHGV